MTIANDPQHTLIVYGSLAPNEKNHYVVAHIKGQWLKGKVRGTLENMGWGADFGYLGFRQDTPHKAKDIPAQILFSQELPKNWADIDDFEGDGYQRVLCQYELENGDLGMGYIYAVSDRS